MKTTYFLLALILLLISKTYAQNYILAGETSGTNIHYTDYNPDISIDLAGSTYGFAYDSLDLDNNGIIDMFFFVSGDRFFPFYDVWESSVELASNVKLITPADLPGCVKELSIGDSINQIQNWSVDTLGFLFSKSILTNDGHYYDYGEFSSGYLGFKIIYENETFFGWINIIAGSTAILIKESAISGLTVSREENQFTLKQFKIYPNPCKELINIQFDENDDSKYQFEIIGAGGIVIKSGALNKSEPSINTADLVQGFYALKIRSGSNKIRIAHFIK